MSGVIIDNSIPAAKHRARIDRFKLREQAFKAAPVLAHAAIRSPLQSRQ